MQPNNPYQLQNPTPAPPPQPSYPPNPGSYSQPATPTNGLRAAPSQQNWQPAQPQQPPQAQSTWDQPRPAQGIQPPQQPSWAQSTQDSQPQQTSQAYSQPVIPGQPQAQLTPEGVSSIDYLDQISYNQKAVAFTKKQLTIIVLVLMIAVVVFVGLMLSNLGSSRQTPTEMGQSLLLRLQTTNQVVETAQDRIKNNNISNLNSTLSLQLASANSQLITAMAEVGIDTKKVDKAILAAESNEELVKKLEDAHLTGTFDRVYSREISYQLKTLMILMNDIHTRSSNQNVKTQLETAYKNIEPLQKQAEELSGSSS